MPRRIVFRPLARAELHQARKWYETQVPGLGIEFARAVDAGLEAIRRYPESFGVVSEHYRRCVLRRFPYSLVYRLMPDTIVVLAVHHHHRDPQEWQRRTE